MKSIKVRNILFIIFILALALRLFAVATYQESGKPLYADARVYDNLAVNIMSGHGFTQVVDGPRVPTSNRMPMYPLFLAGVYSVCGHSYLAVRIIQAILGALFCVVIFFITNIIYNDIKSGILAALMAVFYKPFVSGFLYYGGPASILSEYFYIFILGVSILFLLYFLKTEKKVFAVLSGIFVGLTILTRPEFALYPVVLFLYLVFSCRFNMKVFFRKFFMMYVFIALVLAPWVTRNYLVQGKFIPLTTVSGFAFWMGNNSVASGGWAYPQHYSKVMDEIKNISEYEKNRIYFKQGIEELKRDKKRIPGLFFKKAIVHWAPFEKGLKVFNPFYAFVLFFGVIGILFFRKHGIMEDIVLMIFAVTTLTAIIIWGDPRYRYPYESYLIIFAAVAITKIYSMIKRKVLAYGKG
ncbi:MAG: glycosyltransferase family 39 protein [Candidatus Gorgyraea atricola]|nr:glycosyltransferase family 39 protein [Candidatus Gorgyraea atricola]